MSDIPTPLFFGKLSWSVSEPLVWDNLSCWFPRRRVSRWHISLDLHKFTTSMAGFNRGVSFAAGYPVTVTLDFNQCSPSVALVSWATVRLSSVQDGIYALGKAHMRSTPSHRSFPTLPLKRSRVRSWILRCRPGRNKNKYTPVTVVLSLGRFMV